jgi:hypothetical protein
MNAGVEIYVELRDGAGYLRPNLHSDHGVDRARSFDHVVNLTALDLGGKVLGLPFICMYRPDD